MNFLNETMFFSLPRQVTTLLKSKEADPNVLMPLHGVTPFHLLIGNDSEAFAEEVTRLFLRHGGNPNVKYVQQPDLYYFLTLKY